MKGLTLENTISGTSSSINNVLPTRCIAIETSD